MYAGLASRFADVRARPAHRDGHRFTVCPEGTGMIEWKSGEPEPIYGAQAGIHTET
ncbi:MAG: hypothetical protein ACREFY_06725 [Acetobacteraceae bacterium]